MSVDVALVRISTLMEHVHAATTFEDAAMAVLSSMMEINPEMVGRGVSSTNGRTYGDAHC